MSLKITNTAITTVGAGVLTAAALVGQVITRSGPVGAFIDTTDTAANIVAGLGQGLANISSPIVFTCDYINSTALIGTLAAGAGVTLTGTLAIPATSYARLLISVTPGSGVVTIVVLYRGATN